MYRTSLFAATYRPHLPLSSSVVDYKQSPQKRKRDLDSSGQDSSASDVTEVSLFDLHLDSASGGLEANAANASASSGESDELEIPEGNFPYAYPGRDPATELLDKEDLFQELKRLKIDPESQLSRNSDSSLRQQLTLRQQHITNVLTILHRCLLRGDYIRASRAWGILLRVEQKRDPRFLRSNGRWGIGAEILLRRNIDVADDDHQNSNTSPISECEDQEDPDLPLISAALCEDGFSKIRTYFDALSVLYPRRKGAPNAIDELVLKHTMFALWIHFVQEHAKVIHRGMQGRQNHPENDIASDIRHPDVGDAKEQFYRSQVYLWDQAKQVHSELEELVMKAEFADDKPLCELRNMARRWVDDLSAFSAPSFQKFDNN